MEKQKIKRYSMAFKMQVIREYEEGATIYSLSKKYSTGPYQINEQENTELTLQLDGLPLSSLPCGTPENNGNHNEGN